MGYRDRSRTDKPKKTWVKPYVSNAVRAGLEAEMEKSVAMADCKSDLICRVNTERSW